MRLLSLGAGVQSTTLLLLAIEGQLEPLDGAIFADTGWEPAAVYVQFERLAAAAKVAGIPVHRVSSGNLREAMLSPEGRYAAIPYFTRNADGSAGMGRRQCTSEYKLAPINRKVRELLGAKAPDFRRVPKGQRVEQWIGFSTDEIGRVSDKHPLSYVQKRYPLLELGWSRSDCERFLRLRNWSTEKSACIGCPYHGNAQWRHLRDERPTEWADAVEFDEAIRKGSKRGIPLDGEAFLHSSRLPLSIAPIDRVTRGEMAGRQLDALELIKDIEAENGDPDGCSPYGCRSGSLIYDEGQEL